MNPFKLPLENFVANEALILGFKASSTQKIPIKIYLQQSSFPYQLVSDVNERFIEQQTQNHMIEITPILSYDSSIDDS